MEEVFALRQELVRAAMHIRRLEGDQNPGGPAQEVEKLREELMAHDKEMGKIAGERDDFAQRLEVVSAELIRIRAEHALCPGQEQLARDFGIERPAEAPAEDAKGDTDASA